MSIIVTRKIGMEAVVLDESTRTQNIGAEQHHACIHLSLSTLIGCLHGSSLIRKTGSQRLPPTAKQIVILAR